MRTGSQLTKNRAIAGSIAATFLVALLSWAMASPVGSSPDDDFHTANIYCLSDPSTCRSDDAAWPERLPYAWWPPNEAGRLDPFYEIARQTYPDLWPYPQMRKLPCYVLNGTTWYAPDASVPADCLNEEDPTDNTPASVDKLGYYPPLYYRAMSLFTGDTIRASVVTWRVVNVIIAVILAVLALALSRPEHRRPLALAWLISSVPLGLFLMASMNSSSWAVAGTAALMGPLVALLGGGRRQRLILARLLFVSASAGMVVGARSEGLLFVVLALACAVILAGRLPMQRSARWALACVVAGGVIAGGVALARSPKLQLRFGGGIQGVLPGSADSSTSTWDSLVNAAYLLQGTYAPGLGWLEVTMPTGAQVLGAAAFWGVAFFGLGVTFSRKSFALLLLLTVLLLGSAVLLVGSGYQQPRYFLPLVYIMTFVILATPLGRSLPEMSSVQRWALVLALGVANSLALLQTTVRYVSGLNTGATNPRAFAAHPVPEWWWDHWLSPFANWLVGSIAFALGCHLLLRKRGPLYSVDGLDPVMGPRTESVVAPTPG